ncbi:MAG: dipeptidase [Gemmatimonadetes bacterium]|nr:dipeptidase [Gemmatimonadota bacterium]
MRRLIASTGAMSALLLMFACTPSQKNAPPEADADLVARAHAIHERIVTIDTHDDIEDDFANTVDPLNADRQVNLEKMKAGGLDVVFFAVYVGQGPRTPEGYARAHDAAEQKFAAIHKMADEMYPDRIEIAYTPDDVERIVGSGKLATVIGMENGYIIGKDLGLLKTYYDQGGRYLTLAHQGHNDISDSANPSERLDDAAEEWGGLSPFGRQVVAEMNRLGMMIDVSHISKKAALDAMRASRAPVIASHSSMRALADVPRNMDDETLLALKDNGGVIQTVALGGYVKVRPEFETAVRALREELGIRGYAGWRDLTDEQRAEYRRRVDELNQKYPQANVSDFVDHIDHAVQLIGIDHVGISSDFDGGGGIEGFNDASEAFNVTLELVRRGYSEDDIRKLWGGNLLRVWRQVESVAGEMQANAG